MSYWRFAAMIATSTVVMFGLMYLNTYVLSQVYWSETRVYMAFLMGAAMAIIMLGFMLSMYSSKAINAAIFVGAAVVFAVSLWLVRSQATVGDVSYMRAMIPHHSIAIMTSSRAQISDPRVRKLADEIIAAQEKEIAEMKYLIADLEGEAAVEMPDPAPAGPAEIGTVSDALARPEIGKLDAAAMTDEEIARALPNGAICTFVRANGAPPILAVRADGNGPAQGVMKLSGTLIPLRSARDEGEAALRSGPLMMAEGVSMRVAGAPGAEPETGEGQTTVPADLLLEIAAGRTVAYRGYYRCAG